MGPGGLAVLPIVPEALVALFIGFAIAAQEIFGLAVLDLFLKTLRHIQTPPVYAAAAPASRVPGFLRVLGFAIVTGSLLTPFFGVRIGQVILDWWASRDRIWCRHGRGSPWRSVP